MTQEGQLLVPAFYRLKTAGTWEDQDLGPAQMANQRQSQGWSPSNCSPRKISGIHEDLAIIIYNLYEQKYKLTHNLYVCGYILTQSLTSMVITSLRVGCVIIRNYHAGVFYPGFLGMHSNIKYSVKQSLALFDQCFRTFLVLMLKERTNVTKKKKKIEDLHLRGNTSNSQIQKVEQCLQGAGGVGIGELLSTVSLWDFEKVQRWMMVMVAGQCECTKCHI